MDENALRTQGVFSCLPGVVLYSVMSLKRSPYTPADFAWTQWSVADIAAMATKIIATEKTQLSALKQIPAAQRTFQNTVAALDLIQNEAQTAFLKIDFLMNVSPLPEVREATKEAVDVLNRELIELSYDEGVYRAVKEYAALGEVLQGPEKKLLETTMRAYRRMGFDLLSEVRTEVKENAKKRAELGTEFGKNINDWKDHIAVTRDELAGLPDSYIAGLCRDDKGKYLVTLEYPDFVPFMESAQNASKRQELADKNSRKGGEENLTILAELVKLRAENAKLLGYKDHADYKTEDRMAKRGQAVGEFLSGLRDGARPLVAKELLDITALKREDTGDKEAEIHYYDVAYYSRMLKEKRYDMDEQKIKEYFPLAAVKNGMFEIYQTLLGVTFTRLEGYKLWHEDVELYEVRNTDGALVSYFMLDLYPREGKYSHAAAFNLVNGHLHKTEGGEGAYVPPVACMVANFPKPIEGNPSLMSHYNVEVFLHEFGHVMHHVLTQAAYPSQSGFATAWDFVEAPSQMLENWAWEHESLKLLTKHHETGEVIPADMVEKLRKARLHMIGHDTMRQLSFAIFDFKIHTEPFGTPLKEVLRNTLIDLMGVAPSPVSLQPAGFGHMGGGYDAGYYGYLWLRVYAADMYTRFRDGKVLDPEVGKAYRQWILEKGSSMEEIDLVRGFLGREPNNKAFLESIGLGG